MTLQPGWDQTEQVNSVTTIPGYNENIDPTDSAIPWLFDDWFHGDFSTDRPASLDEALGDKNPSLDEYDRPFPRYRMNSVIEIGFNTPDGLTIPDSDDAWEVVFDESNQASITLEGEGNPFRNELDYYDSNQPGDYHPSIVKGPHTAIDRVTIDGVDGIRGSIIYGGSDYYLDRAKSEGELAAIISGTGLALPAWYISYKYQITTFYTFTDFVFMADGTKLARMWDASRYPAHALYMGGRKEDQSVFEEGIQWTTDQYLGHIAFENFAREGNTVGLTPFDAAGSFGYRNGFRLGAGSHPVAFGRDTGDVLLSEGIEEALPDPLFPANIDNPI
ncbi:hypothetical protein [Haloprofundus sp. MHR1]|uniref:hypothetical protein n=1 Tax=Haloprofundus sp. MHR1 TaxID=2572921 RepID=UPI0010BEE674|nr:hypothetical protein [Haloprofundus sp. MHR1]QCJ46399.1 hypothetical protein FCF25_04360 [Haloprofundus sp. MHR1]